MATQFSTLLKLALPVQGELSGTWGDLLNNSVTNMVEEAIAGSKTINTWSGNSATLSTADGATAEARAAILNLTDTGTSLSGAATVIVPALTKTFIVKNGTAQTVTVKTSSGTGIAIISGSTGHVYCDGTNVVESQNYVAGNFGVGGNLTVTGTTTFNGGTVTLGDANTDNIVFGGEVDSNIIPDDDGTYDLGSSSKEWKDIYIDGVAYLDAINFNGTAITATAAELNIMDGVTSTAAELNILDGVTSTAAELNIVDGGTSATSTTLADADRVVVNDNGTMVQVALTDFETYFESALDTLSNVTTVGALNSGSITSGFGTIDTGSSTITTTGLITGGSLDIDDVVINGSTIGHTDDTDLMTVASGLLTVAGEVSMTTLDIGGTNVTSTAAELNILDGVTSTTAELNILDGVTATTAELNYSDTGQSVGTVVASKVVTVDSNKDVASFRNITLTGELDAGSLDISGDADIDGTLEADAITVNGTALNTVIAAVTVANATLSATTTVTDSTANTNFPVVFHDESNGLLDDTGALRYNPSTGELLVPKLTVAGTTTTVDTVTMNAQNAIIFEGATADANETTLTIVDPTADRTINLPNQSGTIPVLAAASNTAITSTPAELNILDGATVVVGEINALDLGSTAVGNAIASKAVILDSNKDYTGIRNFTITGELDAGSLDISGDADIDGTLETDALSINGTAVTSTAAELNILDGVTATTAELNYSDTGAAVGTVVASKVVTADANKDVASFRNITLTGELDAGSLDVSGDADIDGTLEADAITVNGATLNSVIADEATALAIALG
jgi:cytoskeletal protein CcmA (bactofilin family)